jgi:hypothetical protein
MYLYFINRDILLIYPYLFIFLELFINIILYNRYSIIPLLLVLQIFILNFFYN